jgi:hypothetical protein
MEHTASCGNAKTPGCRCGGCAGSQHGWKGALALAKPENAPEREARRAASECEWNEASQSVPETRLTRRKAAAAVASAKADVIEWLSNAATDPPSTEPAAVSQVIEALGNVISIDVFDALCKALGASNNAMTRLELAKNHLFCSLPAALSCSMHKFTNNLDKLTRAIATSIVTYFIDSQQVNHSSFITDATAEVAVKGVGRLINTLAAAQHFDNLRRAIQILAIMMCPEPERHEEVVRCCIRPLSKPIISNVVQGRLEAAMPDWMA